MFQGVKGLLRRVLQRDSDILGVLHISATTPHGPLRDQIDEVIANVRREEETGVEMLLVSSSQRNDRPARNWPGPKLAAQDCDCGALPLTAHRAACDMQSQSGHIVETRGPSNRQFNLHPFGYSLVRLE
jgi:hypothetical protein